MHSVFPSAEDKAGIKKEAGIHSLRHSFATHLLEKGANIKYIKHLAGNQITNETFVAKSGFSWRSWGESSAFLKDLEVKKSTCYSQAPFVLNEGIKVQKRNFMAQVKLPWRN